MTTTARVINDLFLRPTGLINFFGELGRKVETPIEELKEQLRKALKIIGEDDNLRKQIQKIVNVEDSSAETDMPSYLKRYMVIKGDKKGSLFEDASEALAVVAELMYEENLAPQDVIEERYYYASPDGSCIEQIPSAELEEILAAEAEEN